MAFDGIVTRALTRELAEKLTGAKIEKIYQPEKTELVFVLRNFKDRYRLYLSANSEGCGLYLTDEDFQNPATPPSFCMLLRKHLTGGIVGAVTQKDWERIVEIDVSGYDEMGDAITYRIICEIMGKHSNLVLVSGKDGRIMDAIKRISPEVNRVRRVLPGADYEYPPAQQKLPLDAVTKEQLLTLWESQEKGFGDYRDTADLVLASLQGVSPAISRDLAENALEIIDRREITPDTVDLGVESATAGALAAVTGDMVAQIEGAAFAPAVYLKEDDSPKDFHVLPIRKYDEVYNKINFDNISDTIAYYYAHRQSSNRIRQKGTSLRKHVQQLQKKRELKKKRLGEDLLDAQNGDTYRLYGELLTANIHAAKTGDKSVTVTNYYDGSELTIPLDVRYAPAKNAQMYFKRYSKAKNAVKEKEAQLVTVDEEIQYLASVLDLIDRAASVEELDAIRGELEDAGYVRVRKKGKGGGKGSKAPAPYSYVTSDGHRVLAGRNNKENDHITFKVAGRNDMWLHTKDIPGSHVILFLKNKEPSETALREAAAIAAFHSKGRQSDNVPVDYTLVRHVKKPNGAKPGMVIFTDNRTLFVTPKLPDTDR